MSPIAPNVIPSHPMAWAGRTLGRGRPVGVKSGAGQAGEVVAKALGMLDNTGRCRGSLRPAGRGPGAIRAGAIRKRRLRYNEIILARTSLTHTRSL
jgi:hypothetical protein